MTYICINMYSQRLGGLNPLKDIAKCAAKVFRILFTAQDFFLFFFEISFFFFLAFYKTLFYLEYTTGLGYNTSLTIIHWEHTTNKV